MRFQHSLLMVECELFGASNVIYSQYIGLVHALFLFSIEIQSKVK